MANISILPAHLLNDFPLDLFNLILSYMPKYKKNKKEVSPSLQKQLTKIQSMKLKGKSAMYMKELEDFCLD